MTTINTEAVVSASASAHTPESDSVPAPTHVSDYSAAGRADWQRRYQRKLIISDLVVTVLAVEMAQWVRFGTGFVAPSTTPVFENYLVASAALAACWLAKLAGRIRISAVALSSAASWRRRRALLSASASHITTACSMKTNQKLRRVQASPCAVRIAA